jgi:6-phosphogluconate dehydrogenase
MDLGMIGFGRMGSGLGEKLIRSGARIVCCDTNSEALQRAHNVGVAVATSSVPEFVRELSVPRTIWLMVPAGATVDDSLNELIPFLTGGDIVVDGGNSNYKDSMLRAKQLGSRGLHFVDVGTSGGVWGLENGFCLMVGGDKVAVDRLAPVFEALAARDGFLHVGPSGAGHFAKMIHNGIEYGLMQAYGEGFELLKSSPFAFDLSRIAHLWNQGSVVRSWLLELVEKALQRDNNLLGIRPYVEDSGEGRWTVQEAIDNAISTPVLMLSLVARFASRNDDAFAAKLVAALRNEFGGHTVRKTHE